MQMPMTWSMKAVVIPLMVILMSLLLFTASESDAAEGPRVFYDNEHGITVNFATAGTHVTEDGELLFTASSNKYDMRKTGVSFFACGEDGVSDRSDPRTFTHEPLSFNGNTVTYKIKGVNENILLAFTDPILLEGYDPVVPVSVEDVPITMLLAVALFLGIMMLAMCMQGMRKADSMISQRNRL